MTIRARAGLSTAAAVTVALVLAAPAPASAAPAPTPSAPARVAVQALPPYQTWISDVSAVAGQAAGYLDGVLPLPSARPAVVLDIDNTALQTTYRPGLTSPATPPILDVARQAAADGAAIFFITARPEILGWQTEINLRSVG